MDWHWYILAVYSFIVFRGSFHLEFFVNPNIHSVSGEIVMIVDQDIFNCLFLFLLELSNQEIVRVIRFGSLCTLLDWVFPSLRVQLIL